MDLLTLIETCNLAKDVGLVLAMALQFSDGNPYAVKSTKDVDLGAEVPHTRDTGLAELRRLMDAGEVPVAGLLPATPEWAQRFERPAEDLLDPCAGLTIATAMLSEFEFECERERVGRTGRDCVLHKYAAAVGLDLFADDVRHFIAQQHVPPAGAGVDLYGEAMERAGVLVPWDAERSWGADKILFSAGALPAPTSAAVNATTTAALPAPASDTKSTAAARHLRRRDAPLMPAGTERLPVAPVPPLPDAGSRGALRVQRQ